MLHHPHLSLQNAEDPVCCDRWVMAAKMPRQSPAVPCSPALLWQIPPEWELCCGLLQEHLRGAGLALLCAWCLWESLLELESVVCLHRMSCLCVWRTELHSLHWMK